MFIVTLIAILIMAYGILGFFLPNLGPVKFRSGFGTNIKFIILGGLIYGLNGLFFYAKPGTAYAVQYLWGGDDAITSQGIKVKAWGRLIPISFEIAIQDTLGEHNQEEGIYYRSAVTREFSDAIKADIATSLVIGVNYQNDSLFLDMADRNRSEEKLVHARILPVYEQIVKNTCKLMSAQDYISGASAQFDFYLRDQLENGMYLTEEKFVEVKKEEPIVIDSTNTRNVTSGGRSRETTRVYQIQMEADGKTPKRDQSNSLKRYGLSVLQAAVTQIDWEASFDTRLDQQKEQVAETQLQKEKAQKEYYATLTVIQTGERQKAEERAKQELAQISTVTAAETAAKAAYHKAEEEKNLKASAQYYSDRTKITADADAYRNSRLVAAGLTPMEKATIEKETAIGVAAEIAKLKLPEVYMAGSNGSGTTNGIIHELIGAELARGMINRK